MPFEGAHQKKSNGPHSVAAMAFANHKLWFFESSSRGRCHSFPSHSLRSTVLFAGTGVILCSASLL